MSDIVEHVMKDAKEAFKELYKTFGKEHEMILPIARAILAGERRARAKALDEAAKVAETGTFQGGFQTRGDERRAFDIARRIRALQSEER